MGEIGHLFIELEEVDSTNLYAERLLSKGPVEEGTIIQAKFQTAGKGQDENRWESLPGQNLTFSIILHPRFLEPSRQFLINKSISLGVNNRVFFTGNIDYDELHKWTCSAHIGLSLIEPVSLSYELALPNKMFEYCMAEIPSLATNLPAMKKVIQDYGIGKIVSSNPDTNEIVSAINEISIDDNYDKYKVACRNAAQILCYEAQEDIIRDIFEND